MEQTFLERLRAQESNLNVLPRNSYFQTVEEVKFASEKTSGRSRREYYIVKKYEILQCGDVEKLVRRRPNPTDPPLLY
ncbi:hypothetical protein V1264_023490 [Littorina saxatilis]|uniref:Uncharacterized protein n=1 Tax=Littorina saxatilis TaxID=31220 RepID=A0AAN9G9S2_9CAEN